jgi:alpha-tubulin suppressor-like RCC1 family protein
VWCIGENQYGQLGDGTTTDRQKFIKVQELPNNITSIGAGYNSTCVLTEVGEVWCWGDNSVGQLGNGTNDNSTLPVKVIGINQ